MPALVVPFTKMHGAGNDFIVLDNRFLHLSAEELSGLARRFCPRHFGIGADGVLALSPLDDAALDYRMDFVNPDGSRAGMCGNGARCLARFARAAGLAAEPLAFASDDGVYRASVPADAGADVRLFVPPPKRFDAALSLEAGGTVPYIWTGTHHTVVYVRDVASANVEKIGPRIRRDGALAPEGANVNFVQILEPAEDGAARVRVRTFEKGVEAETLACGTGALAAALVPRLMGRVEGEAVEVQAEGGTLRVGFRLGEQGHVRDLWLEGPAETVFQGTLEL